MAGTRERAASGLRITKVGGYFKGGRESFYVVTVNGVEVGALRKFRDTRTDTYPWQAFTVLKPEPGKLYPTRDLIGSFYRADGYKDAAIGAVLKNAGV